MAHCDSVQEEQPYTSTKNAIINCNYVKRDDNDICKYVLQIHRKI